MHNKYAFRFVEHEIYRYPHIKEAIKELEEDIILSTPIAQEIRSTDVKDPTGSTAVRLHSDERINMLLKTVVAVDVAWIGLGADQREILEYKYWENKDATWEYVADLHYVSRKTLYNWRSVVVKEVGIRMGVM